ncbi:hypothetical protein [Nocardioides zeae]|uniref:Uncharacterized protein n=1 Tax=Nocardioides zeae TaxID=1457234 RepID=A0A6P0HEN7_9ACTN|nr:hypothetical protein [Nocardioides zeae]NEN77178.1 hypothetical protein [Nocardioides zeae]
MDDGRRPAAISGTVVVVRVRRSTASGRHRATHGATHGAIHGATRRAGAGVPRGLLVAALALVVGPLVAGVALALAGTGGATVGVRPVVDADADAEAGARAVVEGWDGRRAAAYAAGDVAALRGLYPPGSALGEEDAAVLTAYVARGLTVHGLRFEVVDLAVEADGPDRVVVVVRDRMARAEVRRGDGAAVARLPARGEAERRLVLERDGEEWRLVASSEPGDQPALTPSEPAPP